MFIALSSTAIKTWKQSKSTSLDESWGTQTHTHTNTHSGILLSHVRDWRNEILPLTTTWIDLDGYYAEWNRIGKDKNNVTSLNMWDLKNKWANITKQK